jgi:hypothetical protein
MTIKSQKRSYGTTIPVPKYHQVSQQPLIQPSQGGMLQSFKESLVGGFGAGIGMNIADRAISSIFGHRKVEVQHTNIGDGSQVSNSNTCQDILNIYKNALSKGESIPQSLEEKYNKCIQSTTS